MRVINCCILPDPSPWHLTTIWPFQSSHVSFDVEDIISISAAERFSLARPMTALSQFGPATLIALTMRVGTPVGHMATIIESDMPNAWLRNCITCLSPRRERKLSYTWFSLHVEISSPFLMETYGARFETKLLTVSSPVSAAVRPTCHSIKNIDHLKARIRFMAIELRSGDM